MVESYEKLGAFYLGKMYDLQTGKRREETLLYDSKDLTTHAVCVGMTGSGKTGLGVTLLEEAAIDGIPAIIIDPKGDLGNLLLTFPELRPADFRPWIDESAAARQGLTGEQFAGQMARAWREGLAEWDQSPERIARFRNAVDLAIYTPGSTTGLPLQVLRSFAAPPPELLDDEDAFRDRVSAAAAGVLALLGLDADPVRSREHILIAKLLDGAWRQGRDLDVAALIREIQAPPFQTVGILDLDTFFPAKDRLELSMRLNNLLASPSFAGWMAGEPLDIKRLLYSPTGKPRLSIVSIAHLSDAERMFLVTILLNEVLAWMRTQSGTSSLRALLYMDEVFGYFPPTANPPSKLPMLTLLKQARAFGLGVVLATQNPVDLDYKGLSNAGTWLIGRLQTERDKARVLDGLEGASAQAAAGFDRQRMETILAGLGQRVFLMNNVHDDEPVVFQTRWTLSYLSGPLTRQQIRELAVPGEPTVSVPAGQEPLPAAIDVTAELSDSMHPPTPPPGFESKVLALHRPDDRRLVYRPALLGSGRLHFVRSSCNLDVWQERSVLASISDAAAARLWDDVVTVDRDQLHFAEQPQAGATFASLPACLGGKTALASSQKQLKTCLYRTQTIALWKCPSLKAYSNPQESEGDFRVRLRQLAHEQRDLEIEKLRKRYAPKLAALQDRVRAAQAAVERETAQYRRASLDTAISIGSSILGALFGRRLASRTNVGKASSSMRSVGRAAQQRGDIGRAEEKVESLQEKLIELEEGFEQQRQRLEATYEIDDLDLDELTVRPRKGDIDILPLVLLWTPWHVDASGIAEPAYALSG